MPLKIKDEPMDDEWKKAPHSPMGNIKDDEVLYSRSYWTIPGPQTATIFSAGVTEFCKRSH